MDFRIRDTTPAERDALLAVLRRAAAVDGDLRSPEEPEAAEAIPAPDALQRTGLRRFTFEAAMAVCSADALRSERETRFLAALGARLGIARADIAAAAAVADVLATLPPPDPLAVDAADLPLLVQRAAIACAALARPLPLAVLAMVALQRRCRQRIALGLGRPAMDPAEPPPVPAAGPCEQVVRTIALLWAADPAAARRETFATTYALAEVARQHDVHAADQAARDELFARLAADGRALFDHCRTEVDAQAEALDPARLPAFVRRH